MHTYTHYVLIVLIALYSVSIPMTIAQIGMPRKPLTKGTVAVITVINIMALAAFILAVGHGV